MSIFTDDLRRSLFVRGWRLTDMETVGDHCHIAAVARADEQLCLKAVVQALWWDYTIIDATVLFD